MEFERTDYTNESVHDTDLGGEMLLRVNPEIILNFWHKEDSGGWAARLPDPYNNSDHQRRLAALSKGEVAEFAQAWNSMLERLTEKIWLDLIFEDAIEEAFGH